jgi:preprotein translocase subunit YajC
MLALLFAPSGQQGGGMSVFIIQIGAFVAIFYFLLIRPQQQQRKRQEALHTSLQKGDQIVTSGGVIGEVIHIKENEITIKSGESRFVVTRSSISAITNRTVSPEVPKEAKSKEIKPA